MAWYKNLKIIVDAIELIKKSGKDFKMIFVGGGFDFEDVKKYAFEKGLENDCIFTGAVKDKALLQGYYLRGDLMIFPSTFDMAPVTAVEAAAHNLCAVMTKGSCSAEATCLPSQRRGNSDWRGKAGLEDEHLRLLSDYRKATAL